MVVVVVDVVVVVAVVVVISVAVVVSVVFFVEDNNFVQLGFPSNMERTARQSSGSNFSVPSLDQLTKSQAVPK